MKKILFMLLPLLGLQINLISQNLPKDPWLQKNFYNVTVDPTNSNYADLQFLKKEIGDKKIVAIGEQTHEDGSTFKARTRLIEFLVNEMDFDAIIFESGMFDVSYGVETYNKSNNIEDFKNSLYDFWSESVHHNQLFSLIQERKKNGKEIGLAGFDCKNVTQYRKRYVKALDSVLISSKVDVKSKIYVDYRLLLERILNAQGMAKHFPELSESDISVLLSGGAWVRDHLCGKNPQYAQIVKTVDQSFISYSNKSLIKLMFFKGDLIKLNNQRDILMADNLNYLLENDFKDKKVILFGATYHFLRNNKGVSKVGRLPIPIDKSVVMGHLMKQKYKKDIYTIGFTAYSGQHDWVRAQSSEEGQVIKPAGDGCLEKILVDNGLSDGVLILNKNEKKPDWWYQDITIRLFSYNSSTACKDWSNVLDAVFFIKNAEPNILR